MATQDKVTLQDQQNQYTKAQKATKEALELVDTLATCQQKLSSDPFTFTPSQSAGAIETLSKLRTDNSQLTFKKAVEGITDFSNSTAVGNAIKANLNIPSLLNQGNNPNLDAQSSATNTFIKSTIRPEVFNAEAHLTNSLNYNYYAGYRDNSINQLNQLRVLFKYTQDTLELAKKYYEQNNIDVSKGFTTYLKNLSECSDIIDKIKNKLNEGNKLSEDLIKTVAIAGAGYVEDAKNPGTFVKSSAPEKDPWGVRFTVTTATNSRVVQKQLQQRADSQSGRTIVQDGQGSGEKGALTPAEKRNNVRIDETVFDEAGAFFDRQSYYMHLLPAIRSNLPIQGGTDVPGVQPGLNFRIEHSIVKHKIPGFQPIYQPMGVDSIRCTLVGCFTGADGMDLWNEQQQLESRLGEREGFKGKQITNIPLDLIGRGDYFESIQKSNRAPGYLNDLANVSIAYDAFKNAQDFYSMIVAPGVEVEVELNLKKNDMVRTKGAPGPFRNTETGNPQFKALIRRMDLYYVRADRCWYILDLEITDGGLIGKECINLTNIIDQTSTSIEEAQQALAELNEEEVDLVKCIEDSNSTMVLKTGGSNNEFYFNGYGYGFFKVRNQGLDNVEVLNPAQIGKLLENSTDGSGELAIDRRSGANPFVNTYTERLYSQMLLEGYKAPEVKDFIFKSTDNLGEPLIFRSGVEGNGKGGYQQFRYRYDPISKNFIRVAMPNITGGKNKIFATQAGGSSSPKNNPQFGDDVLPAPAFLKLLTNGSVIPGTFNLITQGRVDNLLRVLAEVQESYEPEGRKPIEEICDSIKNKPLPYINSRPSIRGDDLEELSSIVDTTNNSNRNRIRAQNIERSITSGTEIELLSTIQIDKARYILSKGTEAKDSKRFFDDKSLEFINSLNIKTDVENINVDRGRKYRVISGDTEEKVLIPLITNDGKPFTITENGKEKLITSKFFIEFTKARNTPSTKGTSNIKIYSDTSANAVTPSSNGGDPKASQTPVVPTSAEP